MSNLNSLLESSNQWKVMQSDAARLASKWDKTGLLEGLGSETEKNKMSLILENQAKQLVVESSQTGGGAGSVGTFQAGQGEQWAGIALPLVRKVFGQIAAKDFVSVQPMSLPSGLVFFLDFQYGGGGAIEGQGGKFATGSGVFGASSMYGDTTSSNAPDKGLYGAGRWTYSTNVTSSVLAEGTFTSASKGEGDGTNITWAELGNDDALSASFVANTIAKLRIPEAKIANGDKEGVRGFIVSNLGGSNTLAADQSKVSAFNTFDGTHYNVFVELGSALDANLDATTIVYVQQPTDQFRGDFEDGNTGLNELNNPIDIPEINVKLKSEAIVAKTKKLKAVYTPEFAQDLNAYHSLDAEAELTSIMSEYISLEIDLEILGMLMENALTTEYWSARNNEVFTSAGAAGTNGTFYNTQGQWFQTLGTKLNKVSNKIHQLTLRGGANFLVCSPTIGTILESIPGFAAADGADADKRRRAMEPSSNSPESSECLMPI